MEDEIELQKPTGLRNWMDDEQRILNIQQNPVREPMKSIRGVFIFVNQQHYIDKIVVEDIDDKSFEETTEFRIPFSKVLQLVQAKRYVTANTKYIFREVCLYNVDLEAEHVQGFVHNEEPRSFFRVLPATEDILIPPSIFIFHSVNALYFYFQEVPLKRVPEPKSILKTGPYENLKEISHNTTKKRVVLKKNPVFVGRNTVGQREKLSHSGHQRWPPNTTNNKGNHLSSRLTKKNVSHVMSRGDDFQELSGQRPVRFEDFSYTSPQVGVEKSSNNGGRSPKLFTRKHISVKNIDT